MSESKEWKVPMKLQNYNMSKKKLGKAVIFNNEFFEGNSKFEIMTTNGHFINYNFKNLYNFQRNTSFITLKLIRFLAALKCPPMNIAKKKSKNSESTNQSYPRQKKLTAFFNILNQRCFKY